MGYHPALEPVSRGGPLWCSGILGLATMTIALYCTAALRTPLSTEHFWPTSDDTNAVGTTPPARAPKTAASEFKDVSVFHILESWTKAEGDQSPSHVSTTEKPTVVNGDMHHIAKSPPVCLTGARIRDHLWIAMTSWNDVDGLQAALLSIEGQQRSFDGIHIVVYEDRGDAMTTDEWRSGWQSRFAHPSTGTHVEFLPTSESKQGAAFGKFAAFEHIRIKAQPHDYVMVMDGDDELPDATVLLDIRAKLAESKPWFAWGKIQGHNQDQCGDVPDHVRYDNLRSIKGKFPFCHPRMFVAAMLHTLQAEDFQRSDKTTWLVKATDRSFIYPFLELAGSSRTLFMGDRPLYTYKFGTHNGLKIYDESIIAGDRELTMSRAPRKPLPNIIHVVACTYDRSNTRHFLQKLLESDTGEDVMQVHICNNMASAQARREQLAVELSASSPHTISVHPTENLRGFSRFILAKEVMRKVYVDYIIMVDDDQYMKPTTIAEIYASRAPKTYKSWYGKNWNRGVQSKYWGNKIQPDMMALRVATSAGEIVSPEVKTWEYGGIGGSIVDASVFQTEELMNVDEKYMFVEDMWLSNVVHSLGWKLERLFVSFEAVDTVSLTTTEKSDEGDAFSDTDSDERERLFGILAVGGHLSTAEEGCLAGLFCDDPQRRSFLQFLDDLQSLYKNCVIPDPAKQVLLSTTEKKETVERKMNHTERLAKSQWRGLRDVKDNMLAELTACETKYFGVYGWTEQQMSDFRLNQEHVAGRLRSEAFKLKQG